MTERLNFCECTYHRPNGKGRFTKNWIIKVAVIHPIAEKVLLFGRLFLIKQNQSKGTFSLG